MMPSRTGRALILTGAAAAAAVAIPIAVSGQGTGRGSEARADQVRQSEPDRRARLEAAAADMTAGPEAAAAARAAAAAAQCQPALSALGQGKLQSGARWHAKLNWQNDAKATYGAGWDNWGVAIDQSTACAHDGRPPLRREWTCIATASACLDEPGGSSGSGGSGGSGGSATGPVCHPALSVEGNDTKTQMPAEAAAVSAWQQAAASSHGAEFQTWAKAKGQDISCRHNGLGPLQRRWRCVATAQPCQ